jgi:hypothetical protein
MGKYLLKDSPKTGTGDLLISVQAIEPLKIPIPNIETNNSMEYYIDQILSNVNDGLDLIELEYEIDKLVYKLFNLSEDEATYIEEHFTS